MKRDLTTLHSGGIIESTVFKKGERIMKKFLSMLLVAILMTAFCSVAFAASYVYFSGHTNVRSGPGLGYSSIGQVNSGSTLPYQGDSSVDSRGVTWYKVSFSGSSGWVSSKYSSLTNNGGTAVYAAGGSGNSYAGNSYSSYSNAGSVYATANAYVRSGPGLNYTQLTGMTTGDYATYLGNTSYDSRGVAWYNVSFNGYTGWVSSAYTSLSGYASYTPSYSSSYSSYGSYVVGTSGDSNVRSGPGLGYSSIGGLSEGESAPYLGETSVDERGVAWYNISYNGRSAWVSSRYTTLY